MHYQEEKLQIVSREKDLALREAEFYRLLTEEETKPRDSSRMMIFDSLKGEARSWYDSKPDSSTFIWPTLKNALLSQYGRTDSIPNALTTVSLMKLTARSESSILINGFDQPSG
ncbi:hypothetical protein AYI68_g3074 [Smittium mucronatum]|uniref:Retrotransposon gag domain-containing protein n=1 Tax=Smittium mucronatum TaxID=133383 RepID=A0A1R0H0Z0_9FUNG|nr:hypothetical protein AYI68_g3074 [Smittium mucronatum]